VAAELPDLDGVDWAPVAPYWSVLWRSGVALASALDEMPLEGKRVVELGCGLAVPSFAAARAGAAVLATDANQDALELVTRNAEATGLDVATATVDWAAPGELLEKPPFDLAIASDILYERPSVTLLLKLLPRIAREAWIADPGRSAASAFAEQAYRRWDVEEHLRGTIRLYRIRLR
jgi:predicted nicotinamide N-methyase